MSALQAIALSAVLGCVTAMLLGVLPLLSKIQTDIAASVQELLSAERTPFNIHIEHKPLK